MIDIHTLPESADSQYLKAKGWRLIGAKRHKYGVIKFWDHPKYQPSRRGAFSQTSAISIQRRLDKRGAQEVK